MLFLTRAEIFNSYESLPTILRLVCSMSVEFFVIQAPLLSYLALLSWYQVLSEVHKLVWCGVTMLHGDRMLNSS